MDSHFFIAPGYWFECDGYDTVKEVGDDWVLMSHINTRIPKSRLIPISITRKFLIDNGFKAIDDGYIYRMSSYTKNSDYIFIQFDINDGIRVCEISRNFSSNGKFHRRLYFVHELQHIMIAFGFEDKAFDLKLNYNPFID